MGKCMDRVKSFFGCLGFLIAIGVVVTGCGSETKTAQPTLDEADPSGSQQEQHEYQEVQEQEVPEEQQSTDLSPDEDGLGGICMHSYNEPILHIEQVVAQPSGLQWLTR